MSAKKRLLGLEIAIMIDKGEIKSSILKLEKLHEEDDFTENEKDVKILITSLLGILKKSLGKNQKE
jgi:hypothetical protein